METSFKASITSEEINLLPVGAFEGDIAVVDTPEAVGEACAYLSERPVIGFDTETRPAFTKGVTNRVALLQLSSGERAFLFRLNRIALERPIIRLLEDEKVIKIGAAIRDDLKGLQKFRHFTPGGFIDLQSIVGDYGITDLSVRKLAAITMGIKISKAQRLSNWEAQQLTPAQQRYAATDAWVSREIYMILTAKQSSRK